MRQRADAVLLRHCFAFDEPAARRVPAQRRLEEAIGPELARMLVRRLTAGRR